MQSKKSEVIKQLVIVFVIFLSISQIHCQSFKPTDLEKFLQVYRTVRSQLFNIVGRTSENEENMKLAKSMNMLQREFPDSEPFPCNVTGFRSEKRPSNVNELRPGDIDVIGAMGDSLTAGFGLVATNLVQVLMENRGLSWSIGGQGTWRQYVTLPNILKEFNPNIVGYSLSDAYAVDRNSQFNPAEGGAISSEMPYMSKVLIKRIVNDPRVNVQEDWKLITIMFGANDFCLDICYHNPVESVLELHRKDLITVLRTLRDSLPRTIINLVPPPDIRVLLEVKNTPKLCQIAHQFECFCFFAKKFRRNRMKYYEIIEQWQKVDEEVAEMAEFHTDTFTVVLQPFIHGIRFPKFGNQDTDLSFMSKDCFHLSQKMNAHAANSLWNNMMQRVGNKSYDSNPFRFKFECPTQEFPYIFTNKNSQL